MRKRWSRGFLFSATRPKTRRILMCNILFSSLYCIYETLIDVYIYSDINCSSKADGKSLKAQRIDFRNGNSWHQHTQRSTNIVTLSFVLYCQLRNRKTVIYEIDVFSNVPHINLRYLNTTIWMYAYIYTCILWAVMLKRARCKYKSLPINLYTQWMTKI